MTWLVTGGAGYIGAHVVRAMVADGQSVVALDDLSTGDAARVDQGAILEHGSILDRGLVRRVLREHEVTGVVHIAAKKQVGESVADPLLYYRENLEGLVALLDGCRAKGVDRFVFSSSAAACPTSTSSARTPPAPRCRRTARPSLSVSGCCATASGPTACG